MKLMTLLTVGRSFKGAKPGLGQYKLQQSLLPKFSSSARPSKAAAARIGERLPKLHAALSERSVNMASPFNEPVAAPVECEKEKTQKIPTGTVLKRVPEAEEKAKFRITAWLVGKIAGLKKRFFPPRSRKKSTAVPTQTEWALEKITVARNDLSDADLEIVESKSAKALRWHIPDFGRVKTTGVEWVKTKTRRFRMSSPFQTPAQNPAAAGQREEKECELAERV